MTIVVQDYDAAIEFFVHTLGFDLVDDAPTQSQDGRPKRCVVVRPRHGETGILLARADNERQAALVGDQTDGRVGFFLEVADFDETYARMAATGVQFVRPPRSESYGQVAVLLDCEGNRWDLLGPSATVTEPSN